MGTKSGSGFSKNPDSVQAASEAIQQALSKIEGTADLIFVFASTAYDYKKVLQEIHSKAGTKNIVGCSTAGEFNESSAGTNSLSVMAIKSDTIKFDLVKATNVKGNFAQVAEDHFKNFKEQNQSMGKEGYRYATITMIMDGLVGNGEDFVKAIYAKTGILSQLVGGAAADDAKFTETNVFFGTEAEPNTIAFIKMFSKSKIGVGVSHGMKNATRPMKVSKSVGGILYELDGKPALEAYKAYAQTKGVTLDKDNTFLYMISNELAIQDLTFSKIRAPIGVNEDGSLVMATEVPQGCMVTIVDSQKDSLLNAAKEAAEEAKKNLGGAKAAAVIVFDCICRQTNLGEDFIKEVKTFGDVLEAPVIGFSTYGEIARFSGTLNGFHNSTAVVCALPE